MNTMTQSVYYKQDIFLSFNSGKTPATINGQPLNQYDKQILPNILCTQSEYLPLRYKKLNESLQKILIQAPMEHFFRYKKNYTLNESCYEKPLVELKNKIHNVYDEYQYNDWDGYGAEPIKYLKEALQFATDLFSESRTLIESVDIIPENDGCLCFDWFKSNNKYINISIENDKLIYSYKFGEERDCGETNFSGKHKLIEQIKKII